ncbi:hypothetical protein [Duganella vulcania]|uniref:Uncharacterized protein n=1 Tax=Duganella vulcania TaxID=2692166 RepID=A0A845GGG3_9BURK|nr:hypothetical protein [Duganella vulcania]MYM92475.1 hypothetical protein [Duganella vulcania]
MNQHEQGTAVAAPADTNVNLASRQVLNLTERELKPWFDAYRNIKANAVDGKPIFGGRTQYLVRHMKRPLQRDQADGYLREHCKATDRHVLVVPIVLASGRGGFAFGAVS